MGIHVKTVCLHISSLCNTQFERIQKGSKLQLLIWIEQFHKIFYIFMINQLPCSEIFDDFDSLFRLLQDSFLALVSSISFELEEWGFWASKIELEAILDLFFFRLKIDGLPWKLPSELSSAKTVLSTAKTVEVNFGVAGRQLSWLVLKLE